MLSKYFKWYILLFLYSLIALADLGLGYPTVLKNAEIIESLEEVDDLNQNKSIINGSLAKKSIDPPFRHRDEDMLDDLKQSQIFSSLKYDVEVLESSEVRKEDLEIEERFRGPAISLNTDNFVNENIEVNANNFDLENSDNKEKSHLILSIMLIVGALVAIGLYVVLVVWRRYIEQRYGMRELLVSNDNQDYWPQDVITS